MDIAFFLKMLCDVSLWFCVAGYFLAPRLSGPAFIPALLIAACAFGCAPLRNKKLPLRLAPLLVLLLLGLWVHSWAELVLFIPICAYIVYICYTRRFEPEFSEFVGYYKAAAAAFIFLSIFLTVAKMNTYLEKYCLPFVLIFLLTGLMLLRLLRMGKQARGEPIFLLLNLAMLVLVCGSAAFVGSHTFLHSLGVGIGLLASKVLAPILLALAYALGGIIWLFSRLFGVLGLHNLSQDVQIDMESFKIITRIAKDTEQSTGGRVLVITLIVIGAACLALVLFLIVRRIAGSRSTNGNEEDAKGPLVGTPGQGRTPAVHGPREQVRGVYRKFLRQLTALGIRIQSSDTSLIISCKASERLDNTALGELREVYIKARYDPSAQISKSDVRLAKDIAARLRSGEDGDSGGASGK